MRLRHSCLLAAVAATGLVGSAAHATLSVSLVPVPISSAAKSADSTLNSARTYDLMVTQTGEQCNVADIKVQFAGGSSGSFYLPAGSNAQGILPTSTITGHENLNYATGITTPMLSTTANGNTLDVLGSSDYPTQTQPSPYSEVLTSSSFDISWGDRYGASDTSSNKNTTGMTGQTYQIAQFTVLGNAGAYITGYVGGSESAFTPEYINNNATGALGTALSAAMPNPSQTGTGGVMYLPLLGDTNYDGAVGLADYNNVENNYGTSGANPLGDTNGDGNVGLADYNNVENNYGGSIPAYSNPTDGPLPAGALGAIVPEPSSLAVLGLIAGGLVSRRRK